MPLTVTATAGLLDRIAQEHTLACLSSALLAPNGVSGNGFMTSSFHRRRDGSRRGALRNDEIDEGPE